MEMGTVKSVAPGGNLEQNSSNVPRCKDAGPDVRMTIGGDSSSFLLGRIYMFIVGNENPHDDENWKSIWGIEYTKKF